MFCFATFSSKTSRRALYRRKCWVTYTLYSKHLRDTDGGWEGLDCHLHSSLSQRWSVGLRSEFCLPVKCFHTKLLLWAFTDLIRDGTEKAHPQSVPTNWKSARWRRRIHHEFPLLGDGRLACSCSATESQTMKLLEVFMLILTPGEVWNCAVI